MCGDCFVCIYLVCQCDGLELGRRNRQITVRGVAVRINTVCQGSALESLDSIPYASDNGVTKGDQREQKHDDGRIGSDSIRVQFASISSGDYLPNHQYD